MSCSLVYFFCFFFFNDTATTEIYTLSLHDALPISSQTACQGDGAALQALRRPRRPHLQGVGEARRLRGVEAGPDHGAGGDHGRDRKSTRLNSSHSQISYAVFCLKKKKERGIMSHFL